MEQVDWGDFKRLVYGEGTPEIKMLRAKKKILKASAQTSTMNDEECRAYAQAVFCAEEELFSSIDKEERKEKKRNCVDLYKQALSRGPSDDQLRFICTASVCSSYKETTDWFELGCMGLFEDRKIIRDIDLSKKLANAMMQWGKSIKDEDPADQNCDRDIAVAIMHTVFSPAVMSAGVEDNCDVRYHPSYQMGTYLFEKLSKRMENDVIAAGRATEYLNRYLDHYIMEAAFGNSPELSKAYANFEKSYVDAYTYAAQERVNRFGLHDDWVKNEGSNNQMHVSKPSKDCRR